MQKERPVEDIEVDNSLEVYDREFPPAFADSAKPKT